MNKFKLFAIVLFFGVFMLSCDKENGEDEILDFEGNWSTEITWQGNNVKDDLTLTRDSFKDMIKLEYQPGIYVAAFGIKGALSSSGNKLNLVVQEVGVLDLEKGSFVWYTSEDEEFLETLESYATTTIVAEYAMEGEKMMLKLDLNGDGEYSEEESAEYSRI